MRSRLLVATVATAVAATAASLTLLAPAAPAPAPALRLTGHDTHHSQPAPHHHRHRHHDDGDHDADDQAPEPTPTTTIPVPSSTTTTTTTTTRPPTTTSTTTTRPTTTTTTTTTPAPLPVPPGVQPVGVPGTWTLTFDDEFNTLDRAKWATNWYAEGGVMNNVGTYARNVSVSGGLLHLTIESGSAGALVHTDIPGGYRLPVGGVVEARVLFPGDGTHIYNWPAWWLACTDGTYPQCGEHDIAEGMSDGTLSVNYHSPAGAFNQPTPPGYWGGTYHTYTLHRLATRADVYWDGRLVASYPTSDNGAAEILILNVGAKGVARYPSTVLVDYVRAWR